MKVMFFFILVQVIKTDHQLPVTLFWLYTGSLLLPEIKEVSVYVAG